MVCEIKWHLAITCALEEFQNSESTNVIFKKNPYLNEHPRAKLNIFH